MATAQPVGERPAWVDDELFPFESRFVALDGNVVHYVDEGSGPILLMLHSNPVWSFVYREVIVALRDGSGASPWTFRGSACPAAPPATTTWPGTTLSCSCPSSTAWTCRN
jgi:haloalkane dehalogenase